MTQQSPVRFTVNSFICLFVVYVIEKMLLPRSYSLITLAGGFLFWLIYTINMEMTTNNGFRAVGIQTPVKNFFGSFAASAALFIVSFAVTLGIEEAIYLIRGGSGLFFDLSNDLKVASNGGEIALGNVGVSAFSLWALGSIGLRLLRALFLEGYFRGVLIGINATDIDDYKHANIVQSILFAVWSSFPIIWTVVKQPGLRANTKSVFSTIAVIALYLFSCYLQAYRHGELRYVRGNVWICIFQMWMFDFCCNIFRAPLVISDYPVMVYYSVVFRGVLLQIVAYAVTKRYVRRASQKAIAHGMEEME